MLVMQIHHMLMKGWKAEKDINEMCLDAYNFVKKE